VAEWLPSEQAWLAAVADRVLNGEIVVLRSIPRWGLTMACRWLASTFSDSAVLVNGRAITEENQREKREQLDSDIRFAVEKNRCAQLIFDDYGRAIHGSQGAILHSMLYRLLVDSEAARDIGAVLVARATDVLDLDFSGSSLIGRAQTLVLPTLTEEDAAMLGVALEALTELVGESTWLARRFVGATSRQGQVDALQHLSHDRRSIVDALPPQAVEVLAGIRSLPNTDSIAREALLCLGRVDARGEFKPAKLVRDSKLFDEVRVTSPGWPASSGDSVQRFASLLDGARDAIWVDRYLLTDPSRAAAFMVRVRKLTSARLRLLVSDDRERVMYTEDIVSALNGIDNIQVRFMERNDRRRLHDRHLILPASRTGFVLPTAGVIFGADDPGSAVSVPMPALAINYSDCWARAIPVFPGRPCGTGISAHLDSRS
jgi:hypothetical protein